MATIARESGRNLATPRILVVGAGGLGCPVTELLAATAGIKVVLSDLDHVDRSNLPRQWLYTEGDVGRLKTEVARARLPNIETTGAMWLQRPQVDGYELVVECSDNTDLKFAISDAAVRARIPIVVGGAVGTRGFSLATVPGRSPCLRCVFEGPSDDMRRSCREAGVLSPLPAMVGAVMAAQAIRLLAGEPSRLWSVDLRGSTRLHEWSRREACVCSRIES